MYWKLITSLVTMLSVVDPASGAAAQEAPTYAEVMEAIRRDQRALITNGVVREKLEVVVLADTSGVIHRSVVAPVAVEVISAKRTERIPILWSTAGDSVVVQWIVLPAELHVVDITDPPQATGRAAEDGPVMTPFTTKPRPLNWSEVDRAFAEQDLNGRIVGSTNLWVYVTADGRVGRAQIERSSGVRALDEAALSAIRLARFEPARNRGPSVSAWIQVLVPGR